MACLYQLLVLGTPSTQQIAEVEELISQSLQAFSLRLGEEVEWVINPATLEIKQQQSTAAVFFGGVNASQENLQNLLQRNIPILPVVSDVTKVQEEIPAVLRSLGCLPYATGGAQRVVTALLECVGLLPSQRRVFVSYRRDEARQTALQLFDELSSRLFDVFLDTHHITPSEDFQAMLWHRLCDSDVLIMLDTPNYFESRWTSAEFGRALAKGIAILRVGWPDVIPSRRTDTTSHIGLLAEDVDQTTGQLTDRAIDQICYQLEAVRSRGHAVRNLNLASHLRIAVEKIGGYVMGVGINKAMYLRLADGKDVVVYTTLSIPTSITLHHAARNSPNSSVAVVYDHVGLHPDWLEHLDWLGNQISVVRWVKATDAAWCFADWEV